MTKGNYLYFDGKRAVPTYDAYANMRVVEVDGTIVRAIVNDPTTYGGYIHNGDFSSEVRQFISVENEDGDKALVLDEEQDEKRQEFRTKHGLMN